MILRPLAPVRDSRGLSWASSVAPHTIHGRNAAASCVTHQKVRALEVADLLSNPSQSGGPLDGDTSVVNSTARIKPSHRHSNTRFSGNPLVMSTITTDVAARRSVRKGEAPLPDPTLAELPASRRVRTVGDGRTFGARFNRSATVAVVGSAGTEQPITLGADDNDDCFSGVPGGSSAASWNQNRTTLRIARAVLASGCGCEPNRLEWPRLGRQAERGVHRRNACGTKKFVTCGACVGHVALVNAGG